MDKNYKNYERARMARMMDLNPDCPADWPVETLERLIAGEKDRGKDWLYLELRSMLTPPRS